HIPRDLETVVLKAMAREPAERYRTAEALADDLHRYLLDRPIRARRLSPGERAWGWCRRNPVVAGLTCAVSLLAVGLALSTLALWVKQSQSEAALSEARTQKRLAEVR